jgi:oxalate decarboxylase
MHSILISSNDICETHLHPAAGETGYIVQGSARLTLIEPYGNNRLHTEDLKASDVYYVPRSYPHRIENVGFTDVEICAFYDKSMPRGIFFTGITPTPLPSDP